MMNKLFFYTTCLVFLCFNVACFAQNSETRSLESFSGITASEGIKVTATKGSKNEARITAKRIDLEDVLSEISGNTLKFSLKGDSHNNVNVEVELTYTGDLENLSANSAGKLIINSSINSNSLEVGASSAGTVEVTGSIKTNDLSIRASSAGTIKVGNTDATKSDFRAASAGQVKVGSGKTENLRINCSSSGSIQAEDFSARNVDAKASSGGHAKFHVTKNLDANASSGGSLRYKGSPSNKDIDKSSGGSVSSY